MLKIAQFIEKSGFLNFEIFSPYFSFWLKIFKIEKTTFLDELGNFKHFEPYFIFDPHDPPYDPPGAPKIHMHGLFSPWGVVTKSNKQPKTNKVFISPAEKNFFFGGVKFTFGGVGGSFFDHFLNFQSKSKSASLPGSGKVIGFV